MMITSGLNHAINFLPASFCNGTVLVMPWVLD